MISKHCHTDEKVPVERLINILYRTSDLLLGRFSQKAKIIANVLFHEWQMNPLAPGFHEAFSDVSDDDVDTTFRKLDKESIRQIKKYLAGVRFIPAGCHDYFFYNTRKFFTPEEYEERKSKLKQLQAEQKKYHFPRSYNGAEIFLAHHGLRLLPASVHDYIRHGNFIDAGSCFGDSALIFLKHYAPQKVYAFEPSSGNRLTCRKYLKRNRIHPTKIELIPYGLGARNETIFFHELSGESNSLRNTEGATTEVEIRTLDSFREENHLSSVKMIKADVEGMGLEMFLGAEKTIREERPLLSLSIYHNKEELFGIYRTLQEWDLNYHCMTRMLGWPTAGFAELSLIAYPAELNQI